MAKIITFVNRLGLKNNVVGTVHYKRNVVHNHLKWRHTTNNYIRTRVGKVQWYVPISIQTDCNIANH